jgi:LL-diaminopimelate aminotransferase
MALYEKRRNILCDGLNALGWKVNKPLATFYIWAPVPSGFTSAEFSNLLLEKAHVLVIPGNGYGPHGEGFVRMSLTVKGDNDGERMREAVKRIGEAGISF